MCFVTLTACVCVCVRQRETEGDDYPLPAPGLDAGEEGQVERAGDLNGLQAEGGRIEGEGDRVDHLGVHQQLWTLAAIPQTSLVKGKKVSTRCSMDTAQDN